MANWVRRSTRFRNQPPQDPYSIGLDNYDLGIQTKTQLMTTFRQVRQLVGLPALPKYLTRDQIIGQFLAHDTLNKHFYVKGAFQHTNKGAVSVVKQSYQPTKEELELEEDIMDVDTSFTTNDDTTDSDDDQDSQASFDPTGYSSGSSDSEDEQGDDEEMDIED